ncbi:hypothetical protein SNA_26765 [Streptomyces natalensis ATCC 27448]|uniref:Uncharacterized protein n=1 Tax=Streptomyces natalensis ATCC 27448 TaxID=1240678 RepID=A0A0D7CH83_9ACTN|nr:hypothetical protein SNA_26765 [Streptomyces natalensis ATCC 27448]
MISTDQTGYGRILGQSLFNSKRLYSGIVTMNNRFADRPRAYEVVPVQWLPAEREGDDVEGQLAEIWNRIVTRSNEDLVEVPVRPGLTPNGPWWHGRLQLRNGTRSVRPGATPASTRQRAPGIPSGAVPPTTAALASNDHIGGLRSVDVEEDTLTDVRGLRFHPREGKRFSLLVRDDPHAVALVEQDDGSLWHRFLRGRVAPPRRVCPTGCAV